MVKLEKAIKKGWFLTIGDDTVDHRWAVTSVELLELSMELKRKMPEIFKEVRIK
jgi:hypothetical protein